MSRWSENLPRGGVNAAESGIAGSEDCDGAWLGIDARGYAHGGSAGGVHLGPDACANSGEKRGTVSRALFGFDNLNGMAEMVRVLGSYPTRW